MGKMIIGIEAHHAEKEGAGNCTYIQNLIKNLALIDKKNKYILYCKNKDFSFYKDIEKVNRNFRVVEIKVKNIFIRIPFFLGIRTYIDKVDIVHSLYYCPLVSRSKRVVTIHDIIPIIYPNLFNKFEVIKQKWFLHLFAKKADKIITISNSSREDISTYLKISNNKISSIYIGVSDDFKEISQDKKINILNKFGIKKPYIYYIGRLDPRKNLENAIKAFSRVSRENNYNLDFVIAGEKNKYFFNRLNNLVNEYNLEKNIKFIGYINNYDNIGLLNFAEFFIFPSFYEGFGLPVLEAMACGCPVITSKGSALEEIARDCAILVNPKSINDIESAMFELLKNRNLKKELIKKGKEKVKEFSWQITARKTLEIYEHLVNKV